MTHMNPPALTRKPSSHYLTVTLVTLGGHYQAYDHETFSRARRYAPMDTDHVTYKLDHILSTWRYP